MKNTIIIAGMAMMTMSASCTNDDKNKTFINTGKKILKEYAICGMIDSPDTCHFSIEDEKMCAIGVDLLRKGGMDQEEIEIASGCYGYEEFKKYHKLTK